MVPSPTSHAQGPLHPEKADSVSCYQGPSASWPTWDPEAKIPTLLGQRPSQEGPAGRDNPAGSSLCRACSSHICQSIQTGKLVPSASWGLGRGKCGEAGHLTKTGPLRVEITLGAQGTESVVERCSTCQREHLGLPGHGLVLAVTHPGAKLYLAHIIEATRQTLAAACETPSENINM